MNNTFEIDNITWNDLGLDDIYSRLNSCVTSAGDDFLYDRLRNPYVRECEEYKNQRFMLEDSVRLSENKVLGEMLAYISKLKHYNFKDELVNICDSNSESNIRHIIIDIVVLVSFGLIFIYPGPGIVAFFVAIWVAVSDYFKKKNIISGKLTVFNYIVKVVRGINKYKVYNTINATELSESTLNVFSRLKELSKIFAPFVSGTFIISEGARTNSNPVSILFDYIRMIFHIDIIKYNSMLNFIKDHKEETFELYTIIGQLDTNICLSKIKQNTRLFVKELCTPDFSEKKEFEVEGMYHPLIEKAVSNSINTKRNMLITGCNASGKSTFLKTVALNALFSQSLGFAFAVTYKGPFFKIYSSMALKDDINAGESYFMSEIKSLKRIIDVHEGELRTKADSSDDYARILCVIDEVLRGTNTIERIASSAEILKSLTSEKILCIAATHDLELTEVLKDFYDNYHFTEDVIEGDIKFSYLLKNGVADTRNAIRLLSVLGYSDDIVDRASKRANLFVQNGVWTSI